MLRSKIPMKMTGTEGGEGQQEREEREEEEEERTERPENVPEEQVRVLVDGRRRVATVELEPE